MWNNQEQVEHLEQLRKRTKEDITEMRKGRIQVTRTIRLKHPIPVLMPVLVDRVNVRKPELSDMKYLPEDFIEKKGKVEPGQVIPLITRLTGLPKSSFGELDLDDLFVIVKGAIDLFEEGLEK